MDCGGLETTVRHFKNMKMERNMKCFYHSADLDGHCSGAIVKMAYPECEMIGINYGQDFPWSSILPDEEVFMVDFGLQPFSWMERLNSICKLTWIDHHKTAVDDAHSVGFMTSGGQVLEEGKAGCELTWRYLHPDAPTPPTVYFLGRYDVWDHSDYRSLQFQYGMRQFKDTSPGNQDFWSKALVAAHGGFVSMVLSDGKLLLEYEQAQNEKFCRAYSFETEINGMIGICANRGFTNSKVFDSVYDPTKHHLMITFCRLKLPAGKWTVSLYTTREDVDCGSIAKSFGGGGHKQAAGFQCEVLPFNF